MKSILKFLNVFTVPPLGVEVKGGEDPILSGTTIKMGCKTWGSNPPAQISWWRAGQKLQEITQTVSF